MSLFFVEEVRNELVSNILPYWMNRMQDMENGGFYGRIDGHDRLHADAPKGAILNARILWTFSAAYRQICNPDYLKVATRAKNYLLQHFWDYENGGVFWQLDATGNPLDTKKQIYAQGFTIYGLSEYTRATGDTETLNKAIELYRLIEQYSFDKVKNGYFEAFSAEWKEIPDVRLSEKDANEKKTMNTHLHILEPYTNLFRVWPSEELCKSLKNLIELFLDKILNKDTGHLRLFFDEDWNQKGETISYGHDIEASWLLYEAASVLNDKKLLERVETVIPKIAEAVSEGIQEDGSLIEELGFERHWWVQAEAVVGFWYVYKLSGNKTYLEQVERTWQYIKNRLVDKEHGEWFWGIKPDGSVNRTDDKAGFWKCPYHNSRMCLEL